MFFGVDTLIEKMAKATTIIPAVETLIVMHIPNVYSDI